MSLSRNVEGLCRVPTFCSESLWSSLPGPRGRSFRVRPAWAPALFDMLFRSNTFLLVQSRNVSSMHASEIHHPNVPVEYIVPLPLKTMIVSVEVSVRSYGSIAEGFVVVNFFTGIPNSLFPEQDSTPM